MKHSRFAGIVLLLVMLFLYLPIVVLVANSFNLSRYGGEWAGFTFDWYVRLWNNKPIRDALSNTLFVGVASMAASTVLGTLAAFCLHRYRNSFLQRVHTVLIWTPPMLPEILMGISLLMFFSALGIDFGYTTMVIAHTTFCVSYVTMVVLARLQDFDNTLLEAAQDLGASGWQTTWKVLVPIILPGILAGALLAFTLSIDDFVISFFVQGKGMTTLPIQVNGMLKRSPMGVINALSTLMVLITFVLLVVSQSLSGGTVAAPGAKAQKADAAA